jgi:hypothetical protein
MDFADAILVHLAGREGVTDIFTIDDDDFETCRIAGRRRFRIVPGRGRAAETLDGVARGVAGAERLM